MKQFKVRLFIMSLVLSFFTHAQDGHKMQHGFILTQNNTFASHLVANGHHSRQTSITGTLEIESIESETAYAERVATSNGESYFLFQASNQEI